METVKRVAKNTGIILSADIFRRIMRLIFFRYIAVYLGVGDFGILTFVLSFSAILGVFISIGLRKFLAREVSRKKEDTGEFVGISLLIKIPLGIFTSIILWLIIHFSKFQLITTHTLIWIAAAAFIGIIRDEMYAIFQAHERMEFEALGNVIDSILILSGGFLLIYIGKNVVWFGMLYFLTNFTLLIYAFFILLRYFSKPKFRLKWEYLKWTIKESLPFGLSTLFYTVYFYIDSVMLSYMKSNTSVGFYNAAYKITFILLFIPAAYLRSIFPLLSQFFITAKNSIYKAYRITLKYFLILACFTGLFIYTYADIIIRLFYGQKYSPSIPVLKTLGIAVAFSFLARVPSNILGAINRQRIDFLVTMGLMFLNVILNFIFIPYLDFLGAGITTLITEFVSFILLTFILLHITRWKIDKKMLLKIIASLGITIFFSFLRISRFLPFIFLLFLFVFRTFGKEDKILIRKIFQKKS